MRIRTVDAFTDRPFTGNPAAVCLLPEGPWPDDTWMRAVALEMNLSETAYVRPAPDGDAQWGLRWFTPVTEVALCGHATLAAAHVLREDGLLGGRAGFATLSGVLTAEALDEAAIALDFPANPPSPETPEAGLAAALGAEPVAAYGTGALGDLLVELADEKAVRGLVPDQAALARLEARGVIVTAAADGTAGGYDFVSRFFAPRQGIPEDPVTGSAHTALAPFWSARLDRPELTGFQASPRGGLVGTRLTADRVVLTGRAVTVLDATLHA
jgi:PhzF family phenazine biosynthesis protein